MKKTVKVRGEPRDLREFIKPVVTVEKCPCGYSACRTWILNGVGNFYQGSGFKEQEARRIAQLINEDGEFPYGR